MPNYQIPPWLAPKDPVQPFLQGVGLGQQAASMQQQANERAAAMAMQRQEAAETAQRYQQDYDLRKYQAEAEMNLRQQSAEMAYNQYANQALAALGIERDIQGGVEPAQAYARHLARLSLGQPLGTGASLLATLAKPKSTPPQVETWNLGGRNVSGLYFPEQGRVQFPPSAGGAIPSSKSILSLADQATFKQLQADVSAAQKKYRDARQLITGVYQNPDQDFLVQGAAAELARAQRSMDDFYKKHPGLTQTPGQPQEGQTIRLRGDTSVPGNMPMYEDAQGMWIYQGSMAEPIKDGQIMDTDPASWYLFQTPDVQEGTTPKP